MYAGISDTRGPYLPSRVYIYANVRDVTARFRSNIIFLPGRVSTNNAEVDSLQYLRAIRRTRAIVKKERKR